MPGKPFDQNENALYIVKDGELTELKPPQDGHGTDEVIWKDGRAIDVIRSTRIRLNGPKKITK
ncbi:DUF3954 domain-containing protein [Jeotgalibacillus haloalkalitolerans]|uniref:DUF3954 domain-containing protein n=1 Tax=Jeotgalibacillus haloalkalitolerans TaxID=3104292 RepID=A0ABU5KM59_9BACL|nr:DUF3954 domain-containing protein [Jeotgalibacillus sp. HH7-29]MDZ5712255.1 DUF3954 domain-containing protein [Jeotgalibacillus sp. HH7-29]